MTGAGNTPASARAAALVRSALVWDNVFPINLPGSIEVGNSWDALESFREAGGENWLRVCRAGWRAD